MRDVVFIDSQSGEVIPTSDEREAPSRRASRPTEPVPEQRVRARTPIWPVVMVFVAIAAFMIGGGVATSFSANEIQQLKMELDYPVVP